MKGGHQLLAQERSLPLLRHRHHHRRLLMHGFE